MIPVIYAQTYINVLPVPSNLDPIVYHSKKKFEKDLDILIMGLENSSDLIDGREGIATDKASLTAAFATFEPSYSLSSSYNIEPKNNWGYNNGGISGDITYNFPTGTNVSLSSNVNTNTSSTSRSKAKFSNGWTVSQQFLQGSSIEVNKAPITNVILTNMANTYALKKNYETTASTILTSMRALKYSLFKHRIIDKNIQKLDNLSKKLDIELKAGKKSKIDVVENQLTIQKQKMAQLSAKQKIKTEMNTLTAAMGISPNSTFTLAPDIAQEIPLLRKLDYYLNLSNNYNTEIRTAGINVETNYLALQTALDQLRWKLSLYAQGDFKKTQDSSYGLTLSIPLSQAQNDKSVIQSKTAYQQSVRSYHRKKHQILAETKTMYLNLQTARENYNISKKMLINNKERDMISLMKFNQGKMSASDFFTNHQSYIDNVASHYQEYNNYLKQYDDFLLYCGILLRERSIYLKHPVLEYSLDKSILKEDIPIKHSPDTT